MRTAKHPRSHHCNGISVSEGVATFGLKPRWTKAMAPSLTTDGAKRIWLRGQDLNLRPSGYEGDFTQPADGRRSSVFQSYRGVGRTAESTAVHAGIHKSPRVWTRSGQSLEMISLYSARRPCTIRSPSSSCGRSPRSRPSLKREHRRHAVADLVADAAYPGDVLRLVLHD